MRDLAFQSRHFSTEIGQLLHLPFLLKLNPFLAGVLGFGLNYGAYEAEIYRAGIASIPIGQWEAAASLGMSPLRIFFRQRGKEKE